ncbi:MAG: hypothetical protein AAF183_19480, partial [Pseudomonadota bacterium]
CDLGDRRGQYHLAVEGVPQPRLERVEVQFRFQIDIGSMLAGPRAGFRLRPHPRNWPMLKVRVRV